MLFAAYGERGPVGPENYLLLVAERSDAYRAAGRRLGSVLAKQPSTVASAVGILAVSPTGTAVREMEQFRAGLGETAPGATTIYRESRSITDKAAALRAVRELRSEGAGYILVKANGLTGACLEELGADSEKAIVEDCGGRDDCGARVLLSVETDWPGTFAAVFRAMTPGASAWSSPELREAWRLAGDDGGR
jgi:hypothetical protein